MGSFFDAFPDISHSTGDLDVQGQTVSATVRVTGTHTEPFVMPQGTLPPTGRAIDIRARNEMDVRDDSIGALCITFDAADFMRQLGLDESALFGRSRRRSAARDWRRDGAHVRTGALRRPRGRRGRARRR